MSSRRTVYTRHVCSYSQNHACLVLHSELRRLEAIRQARQCASMFCTYYHHLPHLPMHIPKPGLPRYGSAAAQLPLLQAATQGSAQPPKEKVTVYSVSDATRRHAMLCCQNKQHV